MYPNNTTKKCNTCRQIFPNTEEYFHKRKISKDGLGFTCKDCARARAKAHRPKAETKRNEKMKTEPEYRANRLEVARKSREKRMENPEYREGYRQKKRAYLSANADERKAYSANWYANNKEHVKEYEQRNAEKKAPIARARVAQWKKDNPEKYKALNKANKAKRRAMELNAEGSHTAKEILALYEEQEGLCAYCGIRLFDEFNVDHYIPISKGGSNSIDNLFCVCPECNSSKRDKMPEEWLAWRNSHVTI